MLSAKYKKIYLLILAFTSGLTIMAVEISASRLLAPYYGTSSFIWTNIIGVIMIALALGYYFGGKFADKYPDLKFLTKIILTACILLLFIPYAASFLINIINQALISINSSAFYIFVGSLISVSILFILPIFLLGAVSPFIIKLLSEIEKGIGTTSGLVFCVSTMGSILGTFLPMLVFIPLWGTRLTMVIFSLILFFIALIGLLNKKIFLLFFLLLLPILSLKMPLYKQAQGAVFEDESVYQYFQVVDDQNLRNLLINEGLGIFSTINREGILTDSYFDLYNLVPYFNGNEKKQDILILGLAGGTISTQLHYFFSQDHVLKIDGVEIDPKIIATAKKYFGLENPSLTVYNYDGRSYLDSTDKKYNSIIIDVYSNQIYISFHLATREFFQKIKGHLQDRGIVAMNVNATSFDSKLLKNITNTMLLDFKHVYLVRQSSDSWNFMVLASDNDLLPEKLNLMNNCHDELELVCKLAAKKFQEIKYDNNFGYLTDDKAPIEYLTDRMILDYVLTK
ncbi:MAG: fused MFS/spermidine synthase [Candidatus Parcubacteria bacterium]|nr:fused MFS/spermidine synthase [Candidatus Parcubacteria bacterium]